jgi:hypothetical protein
MWGLTLIAAAAMIPGVASAAGLAVNVWIDRGSDAVYEPGDRVQIRARCSDDANLLVYDVDAEGYIRVLFPYHDRNGYVDGRQTLMIPDANASDQLVVRGPVGQGYVVAIASQAPFRDLPWYLRPYDPQAEGVGYVGGPDNSEAEEEGVSREGRIVGDPFVAIERIRRRVLSDPDDRDGFATAYVTYYVHDRVRYPRYVCYDCHRPGRYAWWADFDPYYTTCSVVDFRVNFGWYWGTPYWSGWVPYYVYVVRPSCPPYYQPWAGTCYSSWDGWRRWNTLWGTHLTRYKPSSPPPGYVPPSRYKWDRRWQDDRPAPPGFLTAAGSRGRGPVQRMPLIEDPEARVVTRVDWRPGGELRRPPARGPAGEAPRDATRPGSVVDRPRRGVERSPVGEATGEGRPAPPRVERPRFERPAPPRVERPRVERPAPPRAEPPRVERPAPPRAERPAPPRAERPAPPRVERPAPPRVERPAPPRAERRAPPRAEPPRAERPASPRNEPPRGKQPAPPPNDDKKSGKDREKHGGGH